MAQGRGITISGTSTLCSSTVLESLDILGHLDFTTICELGGITFRTRNKVQYEPDTAYSYRQNQWWCQYLIQATAFMLIFAMKRNM